MCHVESFLEKGIIMAWAERICSFQKSCVSHPFGLLFDTQSPFFSAIPKVFSSLTVAEEDSSRMKRASRESDCLVSRSFSQEYQIFRCLGPTTRVVDLGIVSNDLLHDTLRYCEDLKSLKLNVPNDINNAVDVYLNMCSLIQQLLSEHAHSTEELKITASRSAFPEVCCSTTDFYISSRSHYSVIEAVYRRCVRYRALAKIRSSWICIYQGKQNLGKHDAMNGRRFSS